MDAILKEFNLYSLSAGGCPLPMSLHLDGYAKHFLSPQWGERAG
jgi:hypothetical protein